MPAISRTLLALLMIGSSVAAEPATLNPPPPRAEVYTLADGRRLVGTYDPVSGLLRIVGTVPATIRIVPASIVARRPAEAADLPDDRPSTPHEREQRARAAATGALAASHRASAERETMLTLARRRQAEADVRSTAAQEAIGPLDAALTAIAEERRDLQGQSDYVANQRALTDLRVSAITLTRSGPTYPGMPIIAPGYGSTTVSELTAELTAADRRLAELDTRLAACDRQRAATLALRATRLVQQRAAQVASTEQATRIAALTAQQARAIVDRDRFATVLTADPTLPTTAAP